MELKFLGELLTGRISKAPRNEDEGGFALVLVAICASVFALFMAFGVDLAYWYLQGEKLQRSADSAALSAAGSLPVASKATAAAIQAAAKNGYTNGADITITPEIINAGKAKVTIVDSGVETFFLGELIPGLKMTRSATAERNSGVALASPFNVLGSGDLILERDDGSQFPAQEFWLAINGVCAAREDGDYFMSRYDANKSLTKTDCPGTIANSAYDNDGYSYYIDVPESQTSGVVVALFDPAANWPTAESPDVNAARSEDPIPETTTTYLLWEVHADGSPDKLLREQAMGPNDYKAVPGSWWTFYNIPAGSFPGGRSYKVQVYTADNGKSSTDVNVFSIMAVREGKTTICDSRTDKSCPRVYGKKAVSVFNDAIPASGQMSSDFFLAGIDSYYAGSTFEASFFDPGEGIGGIEIIMPNGQPATFDWKVYPADLPGQTDVKFLDTSGELPPSNPGVQGDAVFNNRRVHMTVRIPDDYEAMVAAEGSNWWSVRYNLETAGAIMDRTTWGADIGSEGPVHLVRDES